MAVRGLVRIYYPRIEVTDRDRLPATGPVLIVANHANSLMDPVVLGITAKRPVHFLAKAPLFDIPVFGPVLSALGMIPAYRASDDSSQTHKNVKSLSDAARWLVEGDAVGIFPEGKSHDLYHVEQVRTGAARIAVQAVEMGATNLRILPIGINYERKDRFGSAVWARIGEPIEFASWMAQHSDKQGKEIVRALTIEMDARLQQVVVHLQETKWEPFLSELEMLRPPVHDPSNPVARLRQRKRLADAMNYFLAHDRTRAEATAAKIEHYRSQVFAAGLTMDSPFLRRQERSLVPTFCGSVLMFLLAVPGMLFHLIPFALTRLVGRIFRAQGRSTIALWRLLMGAPIYLLWYGLACWWISRQLTIWAGVGCLVIMPLAGVVALRFCQRAKPALAGGRRLVRLLWRPSELESLRSERQQISAELASMAAEYARACEPDSAGVNDTR